MEKEEVLLENYKDLEENLNEFRRNLIFIDDVYAQKLEEIEEDLEHKIFNLTDSKFYQTWQDDFVELKTKVDSCFKDFSFESAFDVYKTFTNLLETQESDILLVNGFPLKQSYSKQGVSDVFLFNLSMLGSIKQQNDFMLSQIQKLESEINNLIKTNKKQ